jgi:hypothetical protein
MKAFLPFHLHLRQAYAPFPVVGPHGFGAFFADGLSSILSRCAA